MSFEKFKLLCWKNFTLQKRSPWGAAIEILFPILVVAIFVVLRNQIDPTDNEELPFGSFTTKEDCLKSVLTLGVSPSGNSALTKLVNSIGNPFKVQWFENAQALESFLVNQNASAAGSTVGLQFENKLGKSADLPKKLKYSIRMAQEATKNTWFTDQVYFVTIGHSAREGHDDFPVTPPYVEECFLLLQDRIEKLFVEESSGKSAPAIKMHRFPYPRVFEDTFITYALIFFPFLFVASMVHSVKRNIVNIALERESQMKELMKIMGLSSSLHWLAWFFKCFVMKEISVVFMCILMCSGIVSNHPIFTYSNPLLIFVFFTIYATSVITFCFLISVIFKKPNTAGTTGCVAFFLTLLPFLFLTKHFYAMSYTLKVLFCLIVNSALGQALRMLLVLEGNEVGLHFGNLFESEPDTKFSLGALMLSMILANFVHVSLTVYIEKVFPGKIGVAEPFYFPITSLVKCIRKRKGKSSPSTEILPDNVPIGDEFEKEPKNLNVGIRIHDLSKKFGSIWTLEKPKWVVDKLNLNIYEDQITALLGHNGAGKTTTMSMLTGMFAPNGGTAFLNGKDIRTEIDEARKSLGLCPQHNVLFDELTVKEHIIFFARLKGITDKRALSDEVRRYVNLLELKDKADEQSRTLSGGMKRRLQIGIALCGHSKIVICDEPSSGMDATGRRALWDLLILEKKGRTILISTHHMDEADVLGDRIAIMAEGKLQTAGSPFFLKRRYGTGYKLICVKKSGCDTAALLKVLKEYAPDTTIEADAQTEVTYVISESHLPIFHKIMKRLEDQADELRISSFGCNLTTLEEVFLKLGTEVRVVHDEQDDDDEQSESGASTTINLEELSGKVRGPARVSYQIQAMFLKKFLYLRRNISLLIGMLFTFVMLTFASFFTPSFALFTTPSLHIGLSGYEGTTSIIKSTSPALTTAYQSLLGKKDDFIVTDQNMTIFILNKASESLATFNRKVMVGASLDTNEATAWFNGQHFHTMPLALNLVNRAFLRSTVGKDFDIELTNDPFVLKASSQAIKAIISDLETSVIQPLMLFYLLMTFWTAFFIAFPIKERESRAKLLQMISGVNRFTFWLSALAFDFLLFISAIILLLAGVAMFQRLHFDTFGVLCQYFVIFIFYGLGGLPAVYALSYLFAEPSTGDPMVKILWYSAALFYGIYFYINLQQGAMYELASKIVYWVGLTLPPFSLVDCFVTIGLTSMVQAPGESILTKQIWENLGMMVLGGVIFLAICLLKDHMLFDWFIYKFLTLSRKLPKISKDLDADVRDEMLRVQNMTNAEIEDKKLVLKDLSKFYGSHLAVNQLNLSVESSECFGLLGINGAGKTTTFKMMTGDEIISSGDAYIRGLSVKNQMRSVHQQIGYCPQFDAVLMDLTGRETLKIFALLRGIPRNEINEISNKLGSELGFIKHLDKKVGAFSGGNKRKLSTALALLGDPPLVFLDEPTTGMDPSAKRQLWNMINKVRNSGRSIVLTSHSMEECEALCTKLAIMVNGEFKCLGSVQHLKNKFSKGFILTVKVGREDEDAFSAIRDRIKKDFPSAVLKEKLMDILTFHITDGLKWSQVFATMAQMKTEVGLADYALTQTSLEQVFLSFTKSGLYKKGQQK